MKHGWQRALGIQVLECLAAGGLTALSQGLGAVPHGIALWGLMPAVGLASACRAVLRGLNNYLAWIAPGAALYAANLLIWGYSPSAGAALLTAFVSLVGAAAGEVLRQRGDAAGKKRHTRR